ncbi:MAG: hypothetical protein ACRBCL_11220 [Maritimibacter sp.]
MQICPIDRGTFFEDPLNAALESKGIGTVSGGGTLMGTDGFAQHVDLELRLTDTSEGALDFVVQTIEDLGAPKGSTLLNDDAKSLRQFGRMEITAISLNGQDLAPEVYESFDSDVFVQTLASALKDAGRYQGHFIGPKWARFFFAGPSYRDMEAVLTPLVTQAAIGEGCEVFQLA